MHYPLSANCNVHARNLQRLITKDSDQYGNLTGPLSAHAVKTLHQTQQRLMTYKELKLHEEMIALSEIESILINMSEPEREIALCGVICIDFHIRLIDAWLEQHTSFA